MVTRHDPDESGSTYTYRNGEKLPLEKEPDAFVVRATGSDVEEIEGESKTKVSPRSTRIRVAPDQLNARMAESRRIAPTHHAYRVSESNSEFLITDRVMVRFKPGTTPEQIDELVARYALDPLDRYSELEFLFQLTDHTAMNPVKLVVALTENETKIVELAENDLNQRVARKQFTPPNDTHYLRSWHLHNHYQHPWVDPRSSSRCEEAWQLLNGYGSADVVIAITDDGCRLDHGDFNQSKFANWGYFKANRLVTSTDPDAVAANMYQSGSNHGTSCAGVAAGEADGVLTVGAAPGCRLLPIKWESDDTALYVTDSKLRKALDWIADKADVMSNSWGMVPDQLFGAIVTDRIRQLSTSGGRRGRGIVFLWAAGNEDCPIEHNGAIDIPYSGGWKYTSTGKTWIGVDTSRRFRNTLVPIPGVMHIAALASTAQRSHYSNYGTGIDLCAPSSNSHAFWRMTVNGLGVVAATGEGNRFSYGFGGTSSATPLVAGIAGLVISANPMLSAAEVISILQNTASKRRHDALCAYAGRPLRSPARLGRVAGRPLRTGGVRQHQPSGRHVEPVVRLRQGGRAARRCRGDSASHPCSCRGRDGILDQRHCHPGRGPERHPGPPHARRRRPGRKPHAADGHRTPVHRRPDRLADQPGRPHGHRSRPQRR